MQRSFPALIFLLVFSVLQAESAPTSEEMEKWFLSDELSPPSSSSDSQLSFIPTPKDKSTLHSINKITIIPKSIKTGWVALKQCYQHLDPVPEMEVVYGYKNMRNLKVVSYKNIEKVFIKGQSVQLENVQHSAALCVSAKVQIFYKNKDGSFRLVNGPFHRQFLDGYFPFHLTLKVTYPSNLLKFIGSKPESQPGFVVKHSNNTLLINSHFTGKLYTNINFKVLPVD